MKILIPLPLTACLMLAASSVHQVSAAPPKSPTPSAKTEPAVGQVSIEIVEPEMDLGKIPSTEIHKFSITITNRGKESYSVQSIQASCGCTAVTPTQKSIAPGEKLEVPITFNPHGFWGPITKDLTVRCTDPARTTFTWHFKADVQCQVIPQPKAAFLEVFEGSESPSVTDIRFVPSTRAIKPKTLLMEGTSSPQPKVEWHLEQGEIKGHLSLGFKDYTPTQAADSYDKQRQERLVLVLEDGSKDWIDVYWTLHPVFNVFPQKVSFSGLKGVTTLEQQVTIICRSPFKILQIKTSSPKLVPRIEPKGTDPNDKISVVAIRLDSKDSATGSTSEILTLITDNPKCPEIKIPIDVSIQ